MKSSTGSFRIHGPSSGPMKAYLTPSVITWAILLPQPSFRFWSAIQPQLSFFPGIVQHLQSVVICRNVYGMIASTACFCEQGIFLSCSLPIVCPIGNHRECQKLFVHIKCWLNSYEKLWKRTLHWFGSQGKSCVCQIIYLKSAIKLALSKSWVQSQREYIYKVDVFFPKKIWDSRDLNLGWFQEPMVRN